jgi:hypothetical protein
MKTGQVRDVRPTPGPLVSKVQHRYPWTTPIAFSRQAPHALYQSSQFLMKTTDGGASWEVISPDLTVATKATWSGKQDEGKAVINTIAPSPVVAGLIWVGTDNGLIHLTRDEGKSWQEVSPQGLAEWSMVSIIDASPFDAGTAYAAVDRHQTDDLNPYVYRTHDFGKTWTKINEGIPAPAYVHAVREDPQRRGLLYAGTEMGVYVSFDDGDHWQPLQLNLPVASVRDLVVKDNDLVIATHGRSFWILDDLTPLRQLSAEVAKADAFLFKPAAAIRVRKNVSRDTPLPPETPAGKNPPAGAIIDYTLKSVPQGDVTLEIFDAQDRLVRKFSSSDKPREVRDVQAFPTYWLRPPAPLSKEAGMNRFVWDLRFERPAALRTDYSIAAAFGEDATQTPEAPLVLPGAYRVRLTVAGRSYTAPLEVRMDPRVQVGADALGRQLDLEMKVAGAMRQSYEAFRKAQDVRRQLAELQKRVAGNPNDKQLAGTLTSLDQKVAALAGGGAQTQSAAAAISLATLNAGLGSLLTIVGGADAAPTAQSVAAFGDYSKALDDQLSAWAVLEKEMAGLNETLRGRQLPVIKISGGTTGPRERGAKAGARIRFRSGPGARAAGSDPRLARPKRARV